MKSTVTPLRGRRVLLVEDNAIRALHDPQLSAIPIVTMTANALAQDLERERACGVSRHLSKPIDLTALHAALCEVLREN